LLTQRIARLLSVMHMRNDPSPSLPSDRDSCQCSCFWLCILIWAQWSWAIASLSQQYGL